MDQRPRKGVAPESDKKASRPTQQGPTVIKGGQVPSEVLAASKPSSPPEVLPASGKQQDIKVVDTSSPSRSQAPTPSSPDSPKTRAKVDKVDKVEVNYSTWDLLGLEMDTEDPLKQREIRKHPITGEVVLVPVGKAKEAGESPTPAPDSLRQEAGFGRDSAKPE